MKKRSVPPILLLLLLLLSNLAVSGQERRERRPAPAGEMKELPIVAELLATPPPTVSEMQPFLGVWKGRVEVPQGTSMDVEITFEVIDGAVRGRSVASFGERQMKSEAAYIRVDGQTLEWGRKSRSGGIFVSRVQLVGDTLEGTEEFTGLTPPPGVSLPPPNQLSFKRSGH